MRSTGSRYRVFTDEQWQRIEPLLPSNQGRRGHPFGEHRRVVEGIAFRYRTG
ncbi:transposase, partial [Citricoccus nitrophenolicus]